MVVIGFTVEASGDTFVMFVADAVVLVPSVSSNDTQIIDGVDLPTPLLLALKQRENGIRLVVGENDLIGGYREEVEKNEVIRAHISIYAVTIQPSTPYRSRFMDFEQKERGQ